MTAFERIQMMQSNPIGYAAMAGREANAIDMRIRSRHDEDCSIWEQWTEQHRIEGETVAVKFYGCRKCRVAIQSNVNSDGSKV